MSSEANANTEQNLPTEESRPQRDEDYHRLPEHPVRVTANEGPKYDFSQPFGKDITSGELASGAVIFLLWTLFFSFGLLVPTSGMRNVLWTGGAESVFKTVGYAFAVATSYTLTNVLFLSCFASILGSLAQRWEVGEHLEEIPPNTRCVAPKRIYIAALLRGFFLYLMFISGFLLVSTENTVIETEFSQYIRIAGMISVVGFIVGYDPNLLLRLMQRILSLANLPLRQGQSQGTGQTSPEEMPPPK